MFGWLKRETTPAPPAGAPAKPDVEGLIADGDRLREAGERAKARDAYLRAHHADPGRVYPLYWLATLDEEFGELDRARDHCQRALLLDPDQIGMLLRFASICAASGDDATALHTYQRIAALDPDLPLLDAHLADHYCRLGRVAEGVAAFERALARDPDDVVLQSNRLFVLNYSDLLTPAQLFAAHRAWGARHESALRAQWQPFAATRDPARRLRIGYVSADLRDHAVASFFEPLVEAHDRERFEIHCFDNSPHAEDSVTLRLREHVSAWHKTANLDDDALAAMIRQAGIDVLVDLSGHTKGNRLLAFARKPAPVQATWLGYLNTTGLTAIDYRITDAHLDPPGETEQFHTERLVRLATHACFAPARESPAVVPSPVNAGEPLTFGSVNQWPKVTDAVKDLWARMLVQAPDARLFVIVRGAQHAPVRERVVADFTERGVRPDQVGVFPFLPTARFLSLLGRVDVALDPFPYGGGTTTLQCLWMGVPVVTLRGRTATSRNAVGALEAVGLSELATATPDAYARAALVLGRDRAMLAALRQTLRDRTAASRLTDANAFARDMERALRAMWETYCARTQ